MNMSFQELYNSLLSKLGSYIDMDNVDIFLRLSPIECLKKDLPITNDNDVKWVYHIIRSNVEQYIALIVHSFGRFAITLGSSSLISFQSDIYIDEGPFFLKKNIDISKTFSTFDIKIHNIFSMKALLKQSQTITIRDNFQYITVKSNKEVLIL